ncbi:uncharacterized protein MAM_03078 [Metarhizium album ARSEF 1941]|uniref:Uncharacterized protein n=1 Tax=Metarhizium album (strain ARSEF 1941) TaxID=1081103 RepID=A0A0B2X2B9_METAS|nr:uncharacterized protein MAM_03078 [Metarhizium album ARSEF 1941]KHN99380.1 hypothetical protein MAM_03078 [Metarhizium album ARSEF 1941]
MLFVAAGAASLGAADVLSPQDVPVQCATICGPIVDLSSQCAPATPRGPKAGGSASEAGAVAVPAGRRRADTGRQGGKRSQTDDQNAHLDGRFSEAISWPTSSAAAHPDSGPLEGHPRPERTATILLVIVEPADPSPQRQPPAPPAAPDTSSRQYAPPNETVPQGPGKLASQPVGSGENPANTATSETADSVVSTAGPVGDGAKSTDVEEQCVCANKSFDVPRVAALCASCITKTGLQETSMRSIMSACKFAERTYRPADDGIVDNVRVSATRPTAMLGSKAGPSSAGRGVSVARRRGMGDASVAACVLTLVLLAT